MKTIQFDLKFVHAMAMRFLFTGLFLIILGGLIFIYPKLLNILVAVGLIASGLMALNLAYKINHYSKIKINL